MVHPIKDLQGDRIPGEQAIGQVSLAVELLQVLPSLLQAGILKAEHGAVII